MIPKSPEWLAHKAELARLRRAKKKASPAAAVAAIAKKTAKNFGAVSRENLSPPPAKKTKAVTTAEVNADIAALGLHAKPPKGPRQSAPGASIQNNLPKVGRPGPPAPRRGAGRKPLYEGGKMTVSSFRASAAQHAEFRAAGGNEWLREILDLRISARKAGK